MNRTVPCPRQSAARAGWRFAIRNPFMQLVGVEPEGLQMPANDAMTPITYAGMSTRQVDFEKCRQLIKEFLDNSFVVVDE